MYIYVRYADISQLSEHCETSAWCPFEAFWVRIDFLHPSSFPRQLYFDIITNSDARYQLSNVGWRTRKPTKYALIALFSTIPSTLKRTYEYFLLTFSSNVDRKWKGRERKKALDVRAKGCLRKHDQQVAASSWDIYESHAAKSELHNKAVLFSSNPLLSVCRSVSVSTYLLCYKCTSEILIITRTWKA